MDKYKKKTNWEPLHWGYYCRMRPFSTKNPALVSPCKEASCTSASYQCCCIISEVYHVHRKEFYNTLAPWQQILLGHRYDKRRKHNFSDFLAKHQLIVQFDQIRRTSTNCRASPCTAVARTRNMLSYTAVRVNSCGRSCNRCFFSSFPSESEKSRKKVGTHTANRYVPHLTLRGQAGSTYTRIRIQRQLALPGL